MLPSLHDDELVDTIIGWMNYRLEISQYKDITTLPKQCQYVYICSKVMKEMKSKGMYLQDFRQIVQYKEIATEGFKAIGNNNLNDYVEIICKLYDEYKDKFETDYGFISFYQEGLIDDFYLFLEDCYSFKKNLILYIRANEPYFGE